ncbi:MAG: tetratricopeptide repeat-containing sulfotransferase family protein, partial [Steroidobacteraceae bacterium]
LAPNAREVRFQLAALLYRAGETASARAEIDSLLKEIPCDPACLALSVAILSSTADVLDSLPIYERLLASYPRESRLWMSYAHILKASGRQADSVQAYREAIRLRPSNAESWWSLANLKTVRLERPDVMAMEEQLGQPGLADEDRLHFHFALGKALEDIGEFPSSFRHYAAGNAMRLGWGDYSADAVTIHVRNTRHFLTREFFKDRAGWGCTDPAPIFIVGLPRAGSTLVEQILASHPMVEGTMELINVTLLARRIAERSSTPGDHDYISRLADLSPEEFTGLGMRFLDDTRVHRAKGCAHFIDKMPNNFGHIGLIHLMLPNSRIIDARRHPLGCCFSNFKQLYSVGQQFSYGLKEVGRYYRDYVDLMAHYDEVLPGRVHRVFYEQMVADTESEIRRLLDYCQLPFDERCLRFFENERTVRTASSEQVRRPIYRDGIDHWKHFEPWLGPLKEGLGEVLERYPAVPEFPPA